MFQNSKINSFMENFISNKKPNICEDFEGSDTIKLFKRNKRRMPEDWLYHEKVITYKYNELGFRTRSVKDIDWKNSIVAFGCSYTFGTGLAEEDTFVYILEKILDIPVINLGVPGSAIDLSCINSLMLHDHYPTPKAILQIWSSPYRYSDFNDRTVVNYLPKSSNYYSNLKWENRSAYYMRADKTLWKDKTIYYEGSFFPNYDFKNKKMDHFLYKDYARDNGHAGIKSHKSAAKIIAENLRNQGL